MPYLTIDPNDIGRQYEAIIRINSQSGKGGVAFIMENEFGYHLPKAMQPEFGSIIKQKSDETDKELTVNEIMDAFTENYLNVKGPYKLLEYHVESRSGQVNVSAKVSRHDRILELSGEGNGPISAFFDALKVQVLQNIALKLIMSMPFQVVQMRKLWRILSWQMVEEQVFLGSDRIETPPLLPLKQ